MSSSTSKSPPRSAWRPLVWWAKPPLSPRARSGQNTDPRSSPRPSLRPTAELAPPLRRSWPRSPKRISKPRPPGYKKPRGSSHVSSRSTTRATSPNATAPSDHLLARLLAPPRLLLRSHSVVLWPRPTLCAKLLMRGVQQWWRCIQ